MVKGYILLTTLCILSLISLLIIACYQGLTLYTHAINSLQHTEIEKMRLLTKLNKIKKTSHCQSPSCTWKDLGYEPCLQITTKIGISGSRHALVILTSENISYQLIARIAFAEKGEVCQGEIKIISSGVLSLCYA